MEKLMDCYMLSAYRCKIYDASVKIHLDTGVIRKDVLMIDSKLYVNEINDLYLTDDKELVCIEKRETDDLVYGLVDVYVLKSAKHSNTYKKMQLLNAECSVETKMLTDDTIPFRIKYAIEKLNEEGGLLESKTFEIDGIKYEVYAEAFPLEKEIHIQF